MYHFSAEMLAALLGNRFSYTQLKVDGAYMLLNILTALVCLPTQIIFIQCVKEILLCSVFEWLLKSEPTAES